MDLEQLKNLLRGKIILLGIGNPLRGDDGVGIELTRRIKNRVSFEVLEAGTVPENFFAKLISQIPDTLILVEAVEFHCPPGTLKIFSLQDIGPLGLSTHDLSLRQFLDLLKQNLPKLEIFILGIQPKQTSLATSISMEVRNTLEKLEHFFMGCYGKGN